MSLDPGARLGPYEILAPLGAGGMGEVYRARHLKLDREVAIKVLPSGLAADADRLARFQQEARTASALNHPGIVTIHDIAEQGGTTYIAMELVEGRTLRDLVEERPMPIDEVLRVASRVAHALEKAHEAGVVHRDIKPANVMLRPDGAVKVLDFGLAKPLAAPDAAAAAPPAAPPGAPPDDPGGRPSVQTREGEFVGTPHYMSPEQLGGGAVDHRSDQFSFGVLLYEMLGGEPPFDGPSLGAVVSAILLRAPRPLSELRRGVPADLEAIVRRCLEKEPGDRFSSMAELGAALSRCARRRARSRFLRSPAFAGPVAAALLLLLAGSWVWVRGARARWAENDAPGEITSSIETGELYQAYRMAREASEYRPDDPEIQEMLDRFTLPFTVRTDPPGAEVRVREYGSTEDDWLRLGVTPFDVRIPYSAMEWRIEKEGYEAIDGAPFSSGALGAFAQGFVLDPVGTRPGGTVRIPGGTLQIPPLIRPTGFLGGAILEPYYLERYEVTNGEFMEFVEAGGYGTPEWWPGPMVRDGVEVPWEEAMALFRDRTGRPGPSTWEGGVHPEGEPGHPVGGVSWFEAAAYCAFRGRSLPTVFHWFWALGQDQVSDILFHSNMDGDAKAPVGSFRGLAAYGTYDMAGNVKEWVWNATEDMRYILGGSWDEPSYLFRHAVAQDPWGRDPTAGLRCAVYPEPPPEHLTGPATRLREPALPEPLSDETFAVIRGLYDYDRDSLDARVERVDDSDPRYRLEVVSFRTAYGEGRMEVHLMIPRGAERPWQSVIWFPGDDVFSRRSSDGYASSWLFDWLPEDGRVLVYPIYRGMYERFEPWERTGGDWPDMVRSWAQDIGRTIDYLETRPDFDVDRIAYFGFSAGALHGPVFAAVEPRLAVSMFIGGGLIPLPLRPEMHPVHFGPRSDTPTLMINGEEDFLHPYESAQRPYLDMLGAPDEDKHLARLPGGHIPSDPREIRREVTDWLDRYFGEPR